MAWAPNVIITRGPAGAWTRPASSRRYWTPAKATIDATSTRAAGTSHHQRRWSKIELRPCSSVVWLLSTHRATPASAKPSSTRSVGHHVLRACRQPEWVGRRPRPVRASPDPLVVRLNLSGAAPDELSSGTRPSGSGTTGRQWTYLM